MKISYVQNEDKSFWYTLDKHMPEAEFAKKVRDKMGYVLWEGDTPIGILRYNLFWDNTPFCNLLFIDWEYQGQGYGKRLMEFWEREMKSMGYDCVMVSTQSNETAQHFYRKLGYKDSGCLVMGDKQPAELFFIKDI